METELGTSRCRGAGECGSVGPGPGVRSSTAASPAAWAARVEQDSESALRASGKTERGETACDYGSAGVVALAGFPHLHGSTWCLSLPAGAGDWNSLL